MSNKDILLCRIVSTEERLYAPFSLLYLSDALEKEGFNVQIWHDFETNLDDLYSLLQNKDFLFVGFNTLTSPHLIPTISASKKVKELDMPVIWGGVHATILPKLCAEKEYIDYVVLREGEKTVCKLANFLQGTSKNIRDIKGLAFYKNGTFFKTENREFVDLDNYYPDFDKVDMSRYFIKDLDLKRVLPIITSRGCPFRCGFCYNNYFNKRTWRGHSVDIAVDQADYLKSEYNIDGIYFHDDLFFLKKERAKKIIRKIGLPFFSESRAPMINEEFIDFLESNGCRVIYIGAESGSEKTLEKINKDISTKDVERAVEALRGSNIIPRLSFIIGFPGEDRNDRNETTKFIEKLKRINPKLEYELKLYCPYPGTPLWPKAQKKFSPSSNEEWSKTTREGVEIPWCSSEEYWARRAILAFKTGKFKKRLENYKMDKIYKLFHPLFSDKLLYNPLMMDVIGKVGKFLKT